MDLLIGLLVSSIGFFLGAKLLNGIRIIDFKHAVIVAIVVALLNGTLGYVLQWITPDKTLNFFTFGFFQFILDAFIIWVAGKVMKEFEVRNFLSALILAIIVASFSSFTCYWISIWTN